MLAHVNTAQATSFKVLHSFSTGLDGAIPPRASSLMSGQFVRHNGGGYPCNCGTVFEIPAHGVKPTLRLYMRKQWRRTDDSLVMDQKAIIWSDYRRRQHWLRRIFKVNLTAPKKRCIILQASRAMAACRSVQSSRRQGKLFGTTSVREKRRRHGFELAPDAQKLCFIPSALGGRHRIARWAYPLAGLLAVRPAITMDNWIRWQ